MDVEFENKFGNQRLHTYIAGEDNQNTIVITHGFGGSSVTLIEMLKCLKDKYKVYCIDLPGMGLSSRHHLNLRSPEEAIEYFTSAIEEWRKKLSLKKFVLVGHSFGGYMAGMYFTKYEEFVEKLILLSPLGMKEGTQEANDKRDEDLMNNMSFLRRQIYKKIKTYIAERKSFSQIFQSTFFPSGFMMNRYLQKRLGLSDLEKKLWKNYYQGVMNQRFSSENALYEIVMFPTLIARIPLGVQLLELNSKKKIQFYYGKENDWMSQEEAVALAMEKQINVKVLYVADAGHQLTIENPIQLSQMIIENF